MHRPPRSPTNIRNPALLAKTFAALSINHYLRETQMKRLLRAISIRQPWVELILRGDKKAEYRSRPTRIRERVYIYASLTPADWPKAWKKVGMQPGGLPTGAILGSVQIVDCRWDSRRDAYAYVLKDPKRLSKPLVAKNQPLPGFWRPKL